MKRWIILGTAGVLTLMMGTSVFAADFSGGALSRMPVHHIKASSYMDVTRNYMRPASGISVAQRCNIGNCNLIDGEWTEHCENYIDADQNNICDNYTGSGYNNSYHGAGYTNSDYYGTGYDNSYNNTDTGDGNTGNNWQGPGYGNGYCGGNGRYNGNGNSYGNGHHSNGNGRGCHRW